MKKILLILSVLLLTVSCNNGLTGNNENPSKRRVDRSSRGVIDSSKYLDFTVVENNANNVTREDLLMALGDRKYINGGSWFKINRNEGTIEFNSSEAYFDGKENLQLYAKFSIDVQAASSDCLYLKRNVKLPGVLMIGMEQFNNDSIPDLAVCLPLYGYSSNRVSVSPVMNGFITMPSGTYWLQK